jgi:hypothetical protein
MARATATLVLAALVLQLVGGVSSLNATWFAADVAEPSFFSSTFDQRRVAMMQVQFDQDVYLAPPDCTTGDFCSASSFAPCCVDCTAAVRSPAGCICPSSPFSTCLDGSLKFTKTIPGNYTGNVDTYEIGIASSCRNILVALDVSAGEADLYASPGFPPGMDRRNNEISFRINFWSQNLGSDVLHFCANASEVSTSRVLILGDVTLCYES